MIGIISDTHGLLRPEVIEALKGCDTVLTEQIARLYLTHPGVDADEIMRKMGY